jgi:hypothetical protein
MMIMSTRAQIVQFLSSEVVGMLLALSQDSCMSSAECHVNVIRVPTAPKTPTLGHLLLHLIGSQTDMLLLRLTGCCCSPAAVAAVAGCALLKLKPLLLLVLLPGLALGAGDDAAAAVASVSGRNRPSTTSPPSAVRAAITPGLQPQVGSTKQRTMCRYALRGPVSCKTSACNCRPVYAVNSHFVAFEHLKQCCSGATWWLHFQLSATVLLPLLLCCY